LTLKATHFVRAEVRVAVAAIEALTWYVPRLPGLYVQP
jgi:hypothetical protein